MRKWLFLMVSGSDLSNLFCCRVFWGHPVAPCSTFFKAETRELFYCFYSARLDSPVSCILLQQAKVFSLQHILRLSQERFSLPRLCSVFLWLDVWSLCSFHSLCGLLFLKNRSPDCSVSPAAYLLESVWLERQYSWKICCSSHNEVSAVFGALISDPCCPVEKRHVWTEPLLYEFYMSSFSQLHVFSLYCWKIAD